MKSILTFSSLTTAARAALAEARVETLGTATAAREMPGIMEAPEATASSRPRRSPRLVQNAPRRPLSAPTSSSRA